MGGEGLVGEGESLPFGGVLIMGLTKGLPA